MVERVNCLRKSLSIAIMNINATKTPAEPKLISLTDLQWDMAHDIIHILGPLEDLTRVLCGQTYSTASMIIPMVQESLAVLIDYKVKCPTVLKVENSSIKIKICK